MSPTKRMAATRCTVPAPGCSAHPGAHTERHARPRTGHRGRRAGAGRGPARGDRGGAGAHVGAGPEPPARVAPVVVPRWIQLVVLPLALLGAWALARAAGPVLLLFIVAGLIALLLNPFVTLLRRARFPRGAAVATVYLALLLVVAGAGVLLADPIANQVSAIRDEVPNIVDDANATLADLQDWLDRNGVDLQVSEPGQTAVDSLGDRLAEGSGELVAFTRDALAAARRGVDRGDPDRRPQRLHAALWRTHRRRGPRGLPAGRRLAGGRLPDARAGRGVRLRPRAVPVLADHGHQRGHRACGSSARSGSSRRARPTRSCSARSTASPS